jgi:hypothetical protein
VAGTGHLACAGFAAQPGDQFVELADAGGAILIAEGISLPEKATGRPLQRSPESCPDL